MIQSIQFCKPLSLNPINAAVVLNNGGAFLVELIPFVVSVLHIISIPSQERLNHYSTVGKFPLPYGCVLSISSNINSIPYRITSDILTSAVLHTDLSLSYISSDIIKLYCFVLPIPLSLVILLPVSIQMRYGSRSFPNQPPTIPTIKRRPMYYRVLWTT